jgi:hypothetical protein
VSDLHTSPRLAGEFYSRPVTGHHEYLGRIEIVSGDAHGPLHHADNTGGFSAERPAA